MYKKLLTAALMGTLFFSLVGVANASDEATTETHAEHAELHADHAEDAHQADQHAEEAAELNIPEDVMAEGELDASKAIQH